MKKIVIFLLSSLFLCADYAPSISSIRTSGYYKGSNIFYFGDSKAVCTNQVLYFVVDLEGQTDSMLSYNPETEKPYLCYVSKSVPSKNQPALSKVMYDEDILIFHNLSQLRGYLSLDKDKVQDSSKTK